MILNPKAVSIQSLGSWAAIEVGYLDHPEANDVDYLAVLRSEMGTVIVVPFLDPGDSRDDFDEAEWQRTLVGLCAKYAAILNEGSVQGAIVEAATYRKRSKEAQS